LSRLEPRASHIPERASIRVPAASPSLASPQTTIRGSAPSPALRQRGDPAPTGPRGARPEDRLRAGWVRVYAGPLRGALEAGWRWRCRYAPLIVISS
jgi:hypothetical protein